MLAAWALAAALITPRELAEVRDLSGLTVSPDGRSAVFRVDRPDTARNTVDMVWWVAPLDGGAPHELARAGDPVWVGQELQDAEVQWSADSAWIYYRACGGDEIQLWRSRRDTGATERLSDDVADVESFRLTSDGTRALYRVGRPREAIRRADAEAYRSGVVVSGRPPQGARLPIDTPRPAGFYDGRSDGASGVRVLDLRSGAVHDADAAEQAELDRLEAPPAVAADARASRVSRAADGRIAFLARSEAPSGPLTPEEKVVARLQARVSWRVSWAQGADAPTATACEAEACAGQGGRLGAVAWRPGGREILFAAMGPDGSTEMTLRAWDVRSGKVREVTSGGFFGASRFGMGDCPVAGDRMICVSSAAASPPRLESIDLASGARRVLFDPNAHLRGRFGPVESLTWRDAEGRGFHGYLLLPPDYRPGQRLPLVITTYACAGFLRGGVGDEYPEHLFAASGMAALCYNHDTGDIGRVIERGPDGAWLPIPGMKLATGAFEAAIDLLDKRGLVDPRKVGLSGLSYGARTTLYAISHSDRFSAASTSGSSDLDPFTDYTSLLAGPASQGIRSLEGSPPAWNDPKGVRRQISPALNAERISAPLLVQVADREFGGDMVQLMAHMKLAKKPIEVVIFPDETHQKWQPAHKLAAYDRNLDWFRFWLQGVEDPDPAKAEQYRRWRAMRPAL